MLAKVPKETAKAKRPTSEHDLVSLVRPCRWRKGRLTACLVMVDGDEPQHQSTADEAQERVDEDPHRGSERAARISLTHPSGRVLYMCR